MLLEVLTTAWGHVRKMIGRTFREWSEWAEANPAPAARQLELVASVFEHRSRAYKRSKGWRARRDRGIAGALREQAIALRAAVDDAKRLRSVCGAKPGTFAGLDTQPISVGK